MKKIILVLTVLLCFNCSTEEQQEPIVKTEKDTIASKEEYRDHQWGRVSAYDVSTDSEVTLLLTYGQHNWLKNGKSQINFLKVDGMPIYFTDWRLPNYPGEVPPIGSPLPFDPDGIPTYPYECTSQASAYLTGGSTIQCISALNTYKNALQSAANATCKIQFSSQVCCNNTNMGSVTIYPNIPNCYTNPSWTPFGS